jgi:Phosphatidylethanolamine-binding protein
MGSMLIESTVPGVRRRARPLRNGRTLSRYLLARVPPSVTGFAEGEASKNSDKYVGGKSLMGVGHYSGPCTPPNTTPHHYTFVLIATDFDPKDMPPGLTRDEVIAKFGPPPTHMKGVAGLVGLFVNPWHNCADAEEPR